MVPATLILFTVGFTDTYALDMDFDTDTVSDAMLPHQ